MSPTVKQRLRPQRSVSLPPGIINAAMTSRNTVIATWMPWTVVSRSSLMSLIITFMLVPAKLQMNCASASGTSTRRNALDGRPAVPPSATSHLPPHEPGRHSTAGHAEVSAGRPRFCLRTRWRSCRSIMASVRAMGLHPMEVISPGRWNVPPLGRHRTPAGGWRRPRPSTAFLLGTRLPCHPILCRMRFDHPVDHPDDRSGSVGSPLDRRAIQREQARSVWSRPGRRRASGS